MNPDTAQPPAQQKPPWRVGAWMLAAVCSFFGLAVSVGSLTVGPFPTGQALYVNYLEYSAFVLVFLHSLFFAWNGIKMHHRGRTLSRNLPRYLEYAYAALISLGLAQVFFMSSQFSDYIAFSAGDDAEVISRIAKQASIHLNDDCPKGGQYFSPAYCEKLRKIVEAPTPSQYILSVVINDKDFLNHPIGSVARGAPMAGIVLVPVMSPIAEAADALRARHEYGASHQPTTTGRAFSWIAFILLPVGIGLRILKTSIELFGNLE